MLKILILRGLPAAGKSTFAKELMEKELNWKRVNKDLLREMCDCGKWSKRNEKMIVILRDELIYSWICEGFNVIVDDTNLSPIHIESIKKIAEDVKGVLNEEVRIEIKDFDTPLFDCIERDSKRPNPVGRKVIMDMYNRYVKKPSPKMCSGNPVPWIICDIDGTLAHSNNRSPYDYSKVGEDKVNEHLKRILENLQEEFRIAIVSGRDSVCSESTKQWLTDNHIHYEELYMRCEGDNRPDEIVKREIFDTFFTDRNVFCVFDDRPKVIRMWKSLGLFVLDCNLLDSRVDF